MRDHVLSDLTKTRRPLLSGIIFRVIRRRNFTGFTLQPRIKKKRKQVGEEKRERKFWPLIGLNRIAVALLELGDWKLGSRQTARREDTFVAISLSISIVFFLLPLLFPSPLLFLSHIYNWIESYSERQARKTSDSNRGNRLSIENLLDSNEALLHADLTSLWTVYRTLLQILFSFFFYFRIVDRSIFRWLLRRFRVPIISFNNRALSPVHGMHLVLFSFDVLSIKRTTALVLLFNK